MQKNVGPGSPCFVAVFVARQTGLYVLPPGASSVRCLASARLLGAAHIPTPATGYCQKQHVKFSTTLSVYIGHVALRLIRKGKGVPVLNSALRHEDLWEVDV
jgi:hypothetical protein